MRTGEKKTAAKYIFFGLLFTIEYPAMGVSVKSIAVYSQVGGTATLPCNNVIQSDCSSTTWIHASSEIKEYSKLVNDGKIKVSSLHEKIKVGSNCSLHIHNVSTADAGSYACRQIIKGQQGKYDAAVYLSVLTVVPVTDLKPDNTMTLRCLLYTYRGPGQCNSYLFHNLTLRWVSDPDSDLQGDPRYQIHTSSCDSNLTTELQQTDNNRKWGCQLTDKGEVKVSQSYTITFSGADRTLTAELPVRLMFVFPALIILMIIDASVYTPPS